jgi:hypothetical protein
MLGACLELAEGVNLKMERSKPLPRAPNEKVPIKYGKKAE